MEFTRFPKIEFPKFSSGDYVRHSTLGEGRVLGVQPNGKIVVKFQNIIQTVYSEDCVDAKSRAT